jgi:hypothetical protein
VDANDAARHEVLDDDLVHLPPSPSDPDGRSGAGLLGEVLPRNPASIASRQ